MKILYKFIAAFLVSAALSGAAFPSQAGNVDITGLGLAKNSPSQLQLHVVGSCRHGEAVFRVQNVGYSTSSFLTFKVFRDRWSQVVSKRRMRLKAGQMATFIVKKVEPSLGEFGIHVDAKSSHSTQVNIIRCS